MSPPPPLTNSQLADLLAAASASATGHMAHALGRAARRKRYLAALRNTDVHILGHPRGRMYGRRVGLTADWDRVFAEAARLGKALEVDAFPDRQDLDSGLLGRANEAGALISIGSDSHHPGQLRYLEYGLGAAALAGVPQERILNFWPVDRLRAWVGRLRGEAASV